MSAETLLEEVNPYGNLQAVVESDGRVCFFYLFGAPDTEFGMRSVWVRNLAKAPPTLDVSAMRSGEPPMNPRPNCVRTDGGPAIRASDLRVVWLPEGNGAALYERDEIIAIIPPWSGHEGFHGFARDCVGEGPLAWALRPDNVLLERFAAAERLWSVWDSAEPWPAISERLISRVERALGPRTNYYAIDGGKWPPKALLRILHGDCVVLVTVGMSLVPMPNVERLVDDPSPFRRVELAGVVPALSGPLKLAPKPG